jgi:hypothetical protein
VDASVDMVGSFHPHVRVRSHVRFNRFHRFHRFHRFIERRE